MPQQMPQGMPPQMPPQMPQGMPPQMAPQMPMQGPPMASMGGLLRRFQGGGSFWEDDFLAMTGITPEQAKNYVLDPAAFNEVKNAYEAAYAKERPDVYNLTYQEAGEPIYIPEQDPYIATESERVTNALNAEEQARREAGQAAIGGWRSAEDRPIGRGQIGELYSSTQRGEKETGFIPEGAPPGLAAFGPRLKGAPIIENGSAGGRAPVVVDATAVVSEDDSAERNGQTGSKPYWMSPDRFRNLQDVQTAGGEGQDALYKMATTSFIHGQAGRNSALSRMRLSSDTTSTELTNKLSKLDADDTKRMQEYSDDIDKYLGELDVLDEEIPDRQSIKDRFKKQIDYGLAQAFFDAAEKGSPNFMTAMAGAMSGAAGVMNKLTGQEQKALYQHATDSFTRKAGRANAAFKRRVELGNEMATRASVASTTSKNYLDALRLQADISDKVIDNARENYNSVITAGGKQAEIKQARRTYFMKYEDQIADNTAAMAKDALGHLTDTKQWQAHYSLEGAIVGVPSAQGTINLTLKKLFRELQEKTIEARKNPDIPNPLENAMNELWKEIEDSNERRIGDRTVMEYFGPDLAAILKTTSIKDATAVAQELRRAYKWIDL